MNTYTINKSVIKKVTYWEVINTKTSAVQAVWRTFQQATVAVLDLNRAQRMLNSRVKPQGAKVIRLVK